MSLLYDISFCWINNKQIIYLRNSHKNSEPNNHRVNLTDLAICRDENLDED